MKALARKGLEFGTIVVFAMLLSGARGLPARLGNECERNTSWSIWNELNSRQTSDTVGGKTTTTQDVSFRSEHSSSRGEKSSRYQTHRKNADGTSQGHDEYSYSDPRGAGCHNEDGEPWKGRLINDDTVDTNGNHKRHQEEYIEKDGKCEKTTRDRVWDARGKLISDTGVVTTEVPCVNTSLEVQWRGDLSMGSLTVLWGPETSLVPLTVKDKTYTGKFTGEWKGKLTSDACNCAGIFPVTIDVKGQEDEFEKVYFNVTIKREKMGSCSCSGGGGTSSFTPKTDEYQFQLPAESGATFTVDGQEGAIKTKVTFTLKLK